MNLFLMIVKAGICLLCLQGVCLAQNNYRDYLSFEAVRTFKTPLNFKSARNLISATHKNKFILISKNLDETNKSMAQYHGLVYDLDKETEVPLTIHVDPELLGNYDIIKGIAFNDNFLLVNFSGVQLIFELKDNKTNLLRQLTFHDISGSIYIDKDEYRLARNSKYDRRDSHNGNYFSIYPLDSSKNTVFKQELEIKGAALNDMKPSKIVAFNKDWAAWVEPINQNLFFYDIPSKTIDTLLNESKNWVMIDEGLLDDITNRKKGPDDLIYTLRDVIETSSRVWEIEFINKNTLLNFYHHPSDSGFNFFCNLYSLQNKKWSPEKNKTELYMMNWRGLKGEINRDNFPFAYNYLNTKPIFTQDYTCLILEQNSEDFEGKLFTEFFETIPTMDFKLRMHVFKNKF